VTVDHRPAASAAVADRPGAVTRPFLHAVSSEHRRLLALALAGLPEQASTDTSQSAAAVGELDLGVGDAVVTPSGTPTTSLQCIIHANVAGSVVTAFILLSWRRPWIGIDRRQDGRETAGESYERQDQ
jgi:hypothetical protein